MSANPQKILYAPEAVVEGGREWHTQTTDGRLDVKPSVLEQMFSLSGRVALVTGGNSGLGRAMALALKKAGAQVAIGSRRADKNAKVGHELGNPEATYELNVRDEASVEQTIATVSERFGRPDILVNSAGIVNRASVLEMEREAWDAVLAINLTGAFLCTKHAGRIMAQQKSGRSSTSRLCMESWLLVRDWGWLTPPPSMASSD